MRSMTAEDMKIWKHEYYIQHREEIRAKQAADYIKNKPRHRKKCREYASTHAEQIRETKRLYRKEHREEIRENATRYRTKNIETIRKQKREDMAKRRKCSLSFRLHENIKRRVSHGLHGHKDGQGTFELLGYTVQELIKHLEKQFQPGMSWGNYGKYGWHIDHIVPVRAFNFERPEDIDFNRCWALKNLRPLWAKENHIKGYSLDKEFQPSLPIAI